METATLTSKGQVTIPKAVRKQLNLKVGDVVEFVVDSDRTAVLRPRNLKADEVFGMLAKGRKSKRAFTVEEMNAGIAKAVREKFLRKEGRR
jgi:AbrB family looped-hinge helix DNA binding protein